MSSSKVDYLQVEGLEVTVVRKRQKRMYIRVKQPDARVVVSAPSYAGLPKVRSFVEKNLPWIYEQRHRVLKAPTQAPTEEDLAAWEEKLRERVPGLVAHWEPILGVSSRKIRYRNMVSRWGSCNVKTGDITLNIQLGDMPAECLEYVVVHELCHLLEPSHNSRFHAYMKRFLPDYKQRQKLLLGKIRR